MLLFVFFWLYPIVTVYVAINQVSFGKHRHHYHYCHRHNALHFPLYR